MNQFLVYQSSGGPITAVLPDVPGVFLSCTAGPVTPVGPTVTTSDVPPSFEFAGGVQGTTYGFTATVTTDLTVQSFNIVVNVVQDQGVLPTQDLGQDPQSFADLLGSLEAGASAVAQPVFLFPPDYDIENGFITWEVLDDQGRIWSVGNAFDVAITSTGVTTKVVGSCLISVPTDIPQSATPYQIRYALIRPDQSVQYSYEQLRITGFPTLQVGAPDQIELQGDRATVSLVSEHFYSNYVVELWSDGSVLASQAVVGASKVGQGYHLSQAIDTSALTPSLVPYKVIWKMWNHENQVYRESSSLWVINDSILQAVEDVKSKVNKARQTLWGTQDSQFPATEIMKWLRRGGDMFNAAYGQFTAFTFVRARGAIREFWLMCSEVVAIEAQYLCEGEKAFQFQGAAISLDVDRTQYLDTAASRIQSQLDQQLKPIKQNLIIKGLTSGDGSGDPTIASAGSAGSVGLTISPAMINNWGTVWPFQASTIPLVKIFI